MSAGIGVYLDRIRALAPTVAAHAEQSGRRLAPAIVDAFRETAFSACCCRRRWAARPLLAVAPHVGRSQLDGSSGWNLAILRRRSAVRPPGA
jgi:hypothetical protein